MTADTTVRDLALITLARAEADKRIRPREYAVLRAAIAAGDEDTMSDETHEVRWLLGDWCHRRGCHEVLHDGSMTGPLEGPHYCCRACAEEGEA